MLPVRNLLERHASLCNHIKDSFESLKWVVEPSPSPRTHSRLTAAIGEKDWETIDSIIETSVLRDHSGISLHQLFAQPLPDSIRCADLKGVSPIVALVAQGAPVGIIKKLYEAGVPFVQRAPESWRIPGASLIHVAVASGHHELIEPLAKCGVNPYAPASDGVTAPIHAVLEGDRKLGAPMAGLAELLNCGVSLRCLPSGEGLHLRGCRIREDLRGFSLFGANLIGADLSESIFDRTTVRGAWYGPDTVLPAQVKPSEFGMRAASLVPEITTGEPRYYSVSELQDLFDASASRRMKYIADEAHRLVASSGSLRAGCLYLQVAEETARFGNRGTGAAMTELLPLLFSQEPGRIEKLLGAIEASMDGLRPPADYHPNEAEFLALLRHPHDRQLDRLGPAGQLTRVLTSIPYWYGSDEKLVMNTEVAHNWGRIGALNFSFARWKYDAMREYRGFQGEYRFTVGPCLLEQYGATPFERQEVHTHRKSDGSTVDIPVRGYAVMPRSKDFSVIRHDENDNPVSIAFDERFLIVLSQPNITISHPEYGTLVISNKSPLFARDYFSHPGYYAERGVGEGMSPDEVLGITPDNLSSLGFRDILSVELNASVVDLQPKVAALLDGFDAFAQDYRRWKFDTNWYTAFSDIPGLEHTMMAGGWTSEGFRSFIDLVERLDRTARDRANGGEYQPPALAFVAHDVPPVNPYSFTDQNQEDRRWLVITPERLAALKDIARGVVRLERLAKTGLLPFFEAGFQVEADLIIVEPQPSWMR